MLRICEGAIRILAWSLAGWSGVHHVRTSQELLASNWGHLSEFWLALLVGSVVMAVRTSLGAPQQTRRVACLVWISASLLVLASPQLTLGVRLDRDWPLLATIGCFGLGCAVHRARAKREWSTVL